MSNLYRRDGTRKIKVMGGLLAARAETLRKVALAGSGLAAVALIGLALGGATVRPLVAALVFLLLTLTVSATRGIRAGLIAALACNLALAYFFLEPAFHFWANDPQHLAALFVFLVVSVIGGSLLENSRVLALEARLGQSQAETLLRLNRTINHLSDEAAMLTTVCEEAVRTFAAEGAAVMARTGSDWPVVTFSGPSNAGRPEDPLRLQHLLAAAGSQESTDGAAEAPVQGLIPLLAAGELIGVLRIDKATRGDRKLIPGFADEASLALSRLELARTAHSAEALRQTDEIKTALLSSISHDLKTPLASIIQSAGSLEDESVDWSDADRRFFLETIIGEAQRLNATLTDLLDLTRLESGTVRPLLAPESAAQLVEDALALAGARLQGREVQIAVPDVTIETDASLMRHVLTNVLENAAVHSRYGAMIRLKGDVSPRHLTLTVENDGPGIEAEEASHVFEPFYRGRMARNSAHGSGLGLSIVKGFVTLCGGSVALESSPTSTQVFIKLPLRTAT